MSVCLWCMRVMTGTVDTFCLFVFNFIYETQDFVWSSHTIKLMGFYPTREIYGRPSQYIEFGTWVHDCDSHCVNQPVEWVHKRHQLRGCLVYIQFLRLRYTLCHMNQRKGA